MGEFAKLIGEVRGLEYAPFKFEVADDLAYWSAGYRIILTRADPFP